MKTALGKREWNLFKLGTWVLEGSPAFCKQGPQGERAVCVFQSWPPLREQLF